MYKLIFADDESLVRTKISKMVDWESAGFTLLGCCANGYELMDMVEDDLPDLVILDINMPFITGLEAAREIRHSYPHIRIVFLTGYTEFEYAKEAIELNAFKYIVKPVATGELLGTLAEVKKALDDEKSRVRRMAELEHVYAQNQKMLIDDIFSGAATIEKISKRALACGFMWTDLTQFQVAALRVDARGRGSHWDGTGDDVLSYALCNVATELMDEARLGLVAPGKNSTVLLLAIAGEGEDIVPALQQCVEQILHTVKSQLHFTVTAGVANAKSGITSIGEGVENAKRLLGLAHSGGGDRMYTQQDTEASEGTHSAVWDAINYIENNYSNVDLSAEDVCRHLHLSPSYLRALFKKQTDTTIISYITKTRMERARTLLSDSSLKTSLVAEMVGYSDPHYFSYCFKRYYKTTPAEIRSVGEPRQANTRSGSPDRQIRGTFSGE